MKCDKPKTKLELIFDFFKMAFKFLDKNQIESIIISLGVAASIVVISAFAVIAALNIEKINAFVALLK